MWGGSFFMFFSKNLSRIAIYALHACFFSQPHGSLSSRHSKDQNFVPDIAIFLGSTQYNEPGIYVMADTDFTHMT